MGNIAAFFDVDGTLYRDSLMIEHFKKLIKYEVLDPAIWHGNAKKTFENWDKRHGNYEDYLEEVAKIYINSMKGLNKDYIDFITNQVVKLKGDRVYRFTRDRIYWHKEQRHFIFFISGAPEFLLSKMAKKYQIDHYKGTEYYIDENNNFTGEINQMWDSNSKTKAIKDFVTQYNIDLDKSYAYGDTNGDFNMLKMVGHPIAINPVKELVINIQNDKELRDKATFIVERKDVIYKIPVNTPIL
ncbi:HAD family hydrolase [Garciella nitratireducens]|uniref:HAD family hydrolase n=1 Tax=Garciella nitratireducens TaxID=218205 RepID=UPI001BD21E20|nr:HAD-IB family hydrolase [Garciella nitratireducens]